MVHCVRFPCGWRLGTDTSRCKYVTVSASSVCGGGARAAFAGPLLLVGSGRSSHTAHLLCSVLPGENSKYPDDARSQACKYADSNAACPRGCGASTPSAKVRGAPATGSATCANCLTYYVCHLACRSDRNVATTYITNTSILGIVFRHCSPVGFALRLFEAAAAESYATRFPGKLTTRLTNINYRTPSWLAFGGQSS